MRKIILTGLLGMLCLLPFEKSYAGPKWELGENSWMKLDFLGQIHFAHQEDASVENDFYMRRGRIMLSGQIMDGIKLFAETDNPNAGKSGASSEMDIQDAFMDIRIGGSSHWVEGGLILLPFSLENFSSAASLLGLDYNSETIKLANTFVWRDYGIMLHGDFGKKVAYRVGIFDGYDSSGGKKNPDAGLRFTGHTAFNLVGDVETGWFYTQDKTAKGNYITIGAGFDSQAKATLSGSEEIDSSAWVLDFQTGAILGQTPYGQADLTVNGAYYGWDNAVFKGDTAFLETGFRISKTMLTFKYAHLSPDITASADDITVGLHYFFKGHNARGGVEYRTGDHEDMMMVGIQFLL